VMCVGNAACTRPKKKGRVAKIPCGRDFLESDAPLQVSISEQQSRRADELYRDRSVRVDGMFIDVHTQQHSSTLDEAGGQVNGICKQAGGQATEKSQEAGTMRYLSMGYSLLTNYSGFRICFAKLVFFRR
jgi:hypothetical protein